MNKKDVQEIHNILQENNPALAKVWERSFKSYIIGRKFPNPETGEKVKFDSLPVREQAKIRKQFRKIKKDKIC